MDDQTAIETCKVMRTELSLCPKLDQCPRDHRHRIQFDALSTLISLVERYDRMMSEATEIRLDRSGYAYSLYKLTNQWGFTGDSDDDFCPDVLTAYDRLKEQTK